MLILDASDHHEIRGRDDMRGAGGNPQKRKGGDVGSDSLGVVRSGLLGWVGRQILPFWFMRTTTERTESKTLLRLSLVMLPFCCDIQRMVPERESDKCRDDPVPMWYLHARMKVGIIKGVYATLYPHT